MTVNLGVDLGARGLRAAFASRDRPAEFVTLPAALWSSPLCEPVASGQLPVAFPSLKSKLGAVTPVGAAGQAHSAPHPAQTLAQVLSTLRERVTAETSTAVERTVISVPARFTSNQRTALLTAAEQAQLGQVTLITDSIAAVIGHTRGKANGTFLVYSMGYEGFELGLVRAEPGRYRSLGYDGAGAPSGAAFDEMVLSGWLAALRRLDGEAAEVGRADWPQLRVAAEFVKERLSEQPEELFPALATGTDGTRQGIVFDLPSFEMAVRARVAPTLDGADRLFARAGIRREEVDGVIMVGGSTQIPQVRRLISGLGAVAVPTTADHIAQGAAVYADLLAAQPNAADEDHYEPDSAGEPILNPAVDAPPLAVTLLTAPASKSPEQHSSGLDYARDLIKDEKLAEAEGMLRRIIADAQQLLTEITAGPAARQHKEPAARPPGQDAPANAAMADVHPDVSAAGPSSQDGNQLLILARRMSGQGDFQNAVATAHRAWEHEPESPSVFEEMIDIHCVAAMANPTIAGFAADEQWLLCALRHDPSSTRIRGLLAERIYLHAEELRRRGQAGEAKRALEHALRWDPQNQAARNLLRRIGRR